MNTICFHVVFIVFMYEKTSKGTVSNAFYNGYASCIESQHSMRSHNARAHALACVQTCTYKVASRGEGVRRAVNSASTVRCTLRSHSQRSTQQRTNTAVGTKCAHTLVCTRTHVHVNGGGWKLRARRGHTHATQRAHRTPDSRRVASSRFTSPR